MIITSIGAQSFYGSIALSVGRCRNIGRKMDRFPQNGAGRSLRIVPFDPMAVRSGLGLSKCVEESFEKFSPGQNDLPTITREIAISTFTFPRTVVLSLDFAVPKGTPVPFGVRYVGVQMWISNQLVFSKKYDLVLSQFCNWKHLLHEIPASVRLEANSLGAGGCREGLWHRGKRCKEFITPQAVATLVSYPRTPHRP